MSDVFPHRRLGVLALALLIALALAACGGSNGGDADVAVGDGGQDLTVAVEDATIAVDQGDGVERPDSWPAEVPKPDGEPTMATAGEFEGGTGGQLWLDWSDLPSGMDTESRIARLARWVIDAEAAGMQYGLRIPGTTLELDAGATHRAACLEALALAPD